MKHTKIIILLLSFSFISVYGQTEEEIQVIREQSNIEILNELAQQYAEDSRRKKEYALSYASQNGIAVYLENRDGSISELIEIASGRIPIYNTTSNVNAAISSRADHLNSGGSLGLNLNGQSITAHVWDGGPVRTTHQEYGSRVMIGDGVTPLNGNSFHATHVTGTILAEGVVPSSKGMAYQGNAITNEWNSDLSEAATASTNGMLLSNHSYGFHPAFIPDWWFGAYTTVSRDWDNLMYNAPYYLMVKAAGNSGNNSSYNGLPLNGNSSYDKLGPRSTPKNSMVVAATNDANISASGDLISVTIASFSSQGPTDDLRIKPDIAGNGVGLYSTYDNSDTAYNSISGTSMATPSVTGSLMLLQQHYNNLNSSFMKAATLKGLALHTADDAGSTGPDVIFGWGLMNTKRAAEAITNVGNSSIIEENTLTSGSSYSFTVTSDGINPLMASISWTDPAGTPNTGVANQTTPVLVNDLDIRITQGGSTYEPYMLTSITTNSTGDNIVDPFERVDVNGASGVYTITVTHKGTLTSNQDYSLVVTGITTSSCLPNLVITTDVPSGTDTQEASSTITASNTIGSSATAIYHAADEVLLTDDFDALNGSVFRAYIEGCTGNYVSRQAASNPREIIIFETPEEEIHEEETFENTMYVSPNPNRGNFTVYFKENESGLLRVYDFRGEIVLEESFESKNKLSVNIQRYLEGMYFVKVITKSQTFTEKVLKK